MIKFLYNWVGHPLMNHFFKGTFRMSGWFFFSLMAMAAIDDFNPFILHSSDNVGIALVSHPFIMFSAKA